MNIKNSSLRASSLKLLSVIALLGATLSTTTYAQFFHGGDFRKIPLGPDGTATNAHVGDTITTTIVYANYDDFNDSHTLSSIRDTVQHHPTAGGAVTSPNLLGIGRQVTLTDDLGISTTFTLTTNGVTLPGFLWSLSLTYLYQVRSGDENLPDGRLIDNAEVQVTDNRDLAGGTPQTFFLTYEGQIVIPAITPPPCVDEVYEAVSDRYNPGGSEHALWIPGISTNLIFTPTNGSWVENSDGTARFTGMVHSRTNTSCGFIIDVHLSGRTTVAPPGSPHKDHNDDVYIENGGPVDTSTWYYYPTFSGTFTGFGPCWDGAILDWTRTGPAWQVGAGANQKNINFGASAWGIFTVIQQRFNGPPLPTTGIADFNIDIKPCVPPPPCVDRVYEAVSDNYNPGGSKHGLWLPGISINLIFTPTPGSWVENPDGTARLTGMVRSRTNTSCGFNVDVQLSGRTTVPPPGSPKKDHDEDVYIENGGPVDPSTWYYYPTFSGTFTGFGPCWEGAILDFTRTGPAWQVGAGANQKNIHFGASAWGIWTVIQQPSSAPPLPTTGIGDFNIDIKICPSACASCEVRYPFASANPKTSVDFNESEVLRAFSGGTMNFDDKIKVWYNDEHALVLGVKRVIVKTSAGTTTTDYSVTPLTANPGSEMFPLVGATDLTGDQAGTDVSDRPMYPAMFITDITTDPLSLSGDWQYGGTPIPPHAVYGTWKAATRTVDKRYSPAKITITMDNDPSENHWNLGTGDPAPSGLKDEGYGAEVVWNVSDLQVDAGQGFQPLQAGHSYRLQFMVHDGDQTKQGGDVGQNCVTVCIPTNTPAPIALPLRVQSLDVMPAGDTRLIIMGISGRSYLIEGSEDLVVWRSIATVLNNNNGVLDFSDPARTARRFYRVKLLP